MRQGTLDGKAPSLSSAFFLLAFTNIIVLCYAAVPCPPLYFLPGTVVNCELPAENRTVDCVNGTENVPRGTMAKYRCERDKTTSDNILKCACKGRWRGVKVFNEFMSKCNISDYSLDGPAELNFTQREIRQLVHLAPEQLTTNKEYQEDGAAYHNYYRAIHHSPALELNQTLSDAAQKWAEQEVGQPVLKTQPWSERSYSQNLYRIMGFGIDAREAVKLAVAAWYQSAYRYNWENPTGQSAFTQVVWKSTTDVGIGVAQKGDQTVVVANYYPPGNVLVANQNADKWAWFRINVLPPNSVNGNSQIQTETSSSTISSTPVMSTTTPTEQSSSIMTTTTTESTTTTQ